jgi:hypothetical protein
MHLHLCVGVHVLVWVRVWVHPRPCGSSCVCVFPHVSLPVAVCSCVYVPVCVCVPACLRVTSRMRLQVRVRSVCLSARLGAWVDALDCLRVSASAHDRVWASKRAFVCVCSYLFVPICCEHLCVLCAKGLRISMCTHLCACARVHVWERASLRMSVSSGVAVCDLCAYFCLYDCECLVYVYLCLTCGCLCVYACARSLSVHEPPFVDISECWVHVGLYGHRACAHTSLYTSVPMHVCVCVSVYLYVTVSVCRCVCASPRIRLWARLQVSVCVNGCGRLSPRVCFQACSCVHICKRVHESFCAHLLDRVFVFEHLCVVNVGSAHIHAYTFLWCVGVHVWARASPCMCVYCNTETELHSCRVSWGRGSSRRKCIMRSFMICWSDKLRMRCARLPPCALVSACLCPCVLVYMCASRAVCLSVPVCMCAYPLRIWTSVRVCVLLNDSLYLFFCDYACLCRCMCARL